MSHRAPILAAAILSLASNALGQPSSPNPWRRVDAALPGTKLEVTLGSGVRRIGRLAAAAEDYLTLEQDHDSGPPTRETIAKSAIAIVETSDSLKDGAALGALVGAGLTAALIQAGASQCKKGCENDMGAGALVAAALFGGLGTAIGLGADAVSSNSAVLYPATGEDPPPAKSFGPLFPRRNSLRVGLLAQSMTMQSTIVGGSATGVGFEAVLQAGPWTNVHAEYSSMHGSFVAKPGAVSPDVLNNVVPAVTRSAGLRHGPVSREIKSTFAALFGVQPRPFGRLRLELLAGVETVGIRKLDYFDAYGADFRRIPGKYMVLDFESPDVGWVTGVDAEIAVTRNLRVVPMLRFHTATDPGPSMRYGVATSWRF